MCHFPSFSLASRFPSLFTPSLLSRLSHSTSSHTPYTLSAPSWIVSPLLIVSRQCLEVHWSWQFCPFFVLNHHWYVCIRHCGHVCLLFMIRICYYRLRISSWPMCLFSKLLFCVLSWTLFLVMRHFDQNDAHLCLWCNMIHHTALLPIVLP